MYVYVYENACSINIINAIIHLCDHTLSGLLVDYDARFINRVAHKDLFAQWI